jgi:hypothetical protein
MLGLAGLAPGDYRIEVAVRTAAGDSARTARSVVIER